MSYARPLVEVHGLSKTFRVHKRAPGVLAALRSVFHRPTESVNAVQDLSFTIGEGERVGFLGPNGAGKTTTLKILAGLLHPTAGQITVAGFLPFRRDPAFLKQITLVMGQKQQLLWDLPPTETYAMNRALYEVPRVQAVETIAELVAALLHRPRVLFLDEPTIGLDVSMQAKMRAFIRHYNERFAAAVLLTSHYMDDVTALCPRVIVIDQGRLVYDGDLKALVRRVRPDKRLTLRLSAPIDRRLLDQIAPVVSYEGGQAVLSVPPERLNATVQNALATLSVVDLAVEDPPLEEVMRELFKNAHAGTPAAAAGASTPGAGASATRPLLATDPGSGS